MTDTDGPFDTKPWSEAQWARHAAMWAPSGVYGPPGASTSTGDLPTFTSGLSAILGPGRAWVRGFGFERTGSPLSQAVTANTHSSFFRRDRLVLRRNLATHTVTPVVLAGTPAGSPAPPALTRSEAGSWDLPLLSFLVPPNSGTSIDGWIDERGWINGSGPVEVPSIAVRDAHFPSPVRGDACTVNGNPHIHDGSGWRFTLYGKVGPVGTDGTGIFQVQHGAGQAPLEWGPTLLNQQTDALNTSLGVLGFGEDSTNLNARFVRSGTYFVGVVSFSWWARF